MQKIGTNVPLDRTHIPWDVEGSLRGAALTCSSPGWFLPSQWDVQAELGASHLQVHLGTQPARGDMLVLQPSATLCVRHACEL